MQSTDGVVEHPVEARIPYREEAKAITNEQSIEALSNPPESLQQIASFLQDPSTIDTTQLFFYLRGGVALLE